MSSLSGRAVVDAVVEYYVISSRQLFSSSLQLAW